MGMTDNQARREPGTYRMADGSIEVIVDTPESASYVEDMWPDEVAYLLAVERKCIADAVRGLMEHEFIDSYEDGTTWIAVDRADVLRIIRRRYVAEGETS